MKRNVSINQFKMTGSITELKVVKLSSDRTPGQQMITLLGLDLQLLSPGTSN